MVVFVLRIMRYLPLKTANLENVIFQSAAKLARLTGKMFCAPVAIIIIIIIIIMSITLPPSLHLSSAIRWSNSSENPKIF